jgi:hypothetical protein
LTALWPSECEEKAPARLRRLEEYVAELRIFNTERFNPPGPIAVGFVPDNDEKIAQALDLLDSKIKFRQRTRKFAFEEIRVTHERHSPSAAFIPAIKHFKKRVRSITGKSHVREIHALAPVILGRDLTDDENATVAYALR